MTDQAIPTDDELRQRLTPEQYEVTQHAGTERAFTGAYWNTNDPGTYHCIVCDAPLFSSETKYESGSGWPSFWEPLDPSRVTLIEDRVARDAAHRGHVRQLWRSSRPPVPRRPSAHGRPLLHELGVVAARSELISRPRPAG